MMGEPVCNVFELFFATLENFLYLFCAHSIIEGVSVSPDVRDIGLPGELVGAQMGEQDGVALLHPVLHVLHPGQTRPRLQTHGPPKLCDHLVLATE